MQHITIRLKLKQLHEARTRIYGLHGGHNNCNITTASVDLHLLLLIISTSETGRTVIICLPSIYLMNTCRTHRVVTLIFVLSVAEVSTLCFIIDSGK